MILYWRWWQSNYFFNSSEPSKLIHHPDYDGRDNDLLHC